MFDTSLADAYNDGEEYDRANGLTGPAIPFYLTLAREVGGPVLDLACGTGFLTIPLAEAGLTVTGVDFAPAMLEHAQRKAKAADLPIQWVLADCRTLDLDEQFRLITMTGNAIQEGFLTRADLEGLFGSARRHLLSDGLFAFETRFPRPSELLTPEALSGDWSAETPWREYDNARGQWVTETSQQRYDAIHQVVEYLLHSRWLEDGREQTLTEPTSLRLIFPQEMEALLHYNGFAIRDVYGDWDRQPMTGSSPRMIYVCTPRS
jgi:SAM-dependent methyltransferase